MRLSSMLAGSTGPLELTKHRDYTRACWLLWAHFRTTVLDAVFRDERTVTAEKLFKLGM